MTRSLSVLLKEALKHIGFPSRRPPPALQEALASHWVALKLNVMRGHIEPGAAIYVDEPDGRRSSGFMTVQAILKTVEDGWAHWDRKTMEWWYRVLDQAVSDLMPEA